VDHVTLLRKIGELKRDGRSLEDIKRSLENELAKAGERELDLPALESDRIREAIIKVATEEFAAKGYKGTHVLAIIQQLGINPHIFYRHFPSKLGLLAECFKDAAPLPLANPPGDASWDLSEKVLHGLTGDTVWHRLSAVLSGAIRSEGLQDRQAQNRLAETWDTLIVDILRDLRNVRGEDFVPGEVADELLAYSMIGAHQAARVRAAWDDKFKSADLLRAHLFLFMAMMAAVGGEVDIYSRVAKYEDLIQELTADNPVLPPALEI
jgi:AcrR family transcriptional regulator